MKKLDFNHPNDQEELKKLLTKLMMEQPIEKSLEEWMKLEQARRDHRELGFMYWI